MAIDKNRLDAAWATTIRWFTDTMGRAPMSDEERRAMRELAGEVLKAADTQDRLRDWRNSHGLQTHYRDD